jgi:RNA polymerase sigma factor (sigma-70 family)
MAERAHAAMLLQRFLDGLPEAQRLAFVLYEIDELDANEAGEALGIAPGTVHARVRLAREKLDRFVARHQSRSAR